MSYSTSRLQAQMESQNTADRLDQLTQELFGSLEPELMEEWRKVQQIPLAATVVVQAAKRTDSGNGKCETCGRKKSGNQELTQTWQVAKENEGSRGGRRHRCSQHRARSDEQRRKVVLRSRVRFRWPNQCHHLKHQWHRWWQPRRWQSLRWQPPHHQWLNQVTLKISLRTINFLTGIGWHWDSS